MTTLFVGLDGALAVVGERQGRWAAELRMAGNGAGRAPAAPPLDGDPYCVAVDPLRPEQVYCGTFTRGLWRSSDAASTWEPAGPGITHDAVQSAAVSAAERVNGYGVVYAGTEPSAVFRSEDRGATWRELQELRRLPSAPTWSFPPRPSTSHVRWITPDPLVAGRVFACIEAGALLRSLDGGRTWQDRVPTSPRDTHTLAMHRLAPNRLYSAAGDGFMAPGTGYVQSDDGGDSWSRPDAGLQQHYLWSVAVDPADPDTIVVSAASGPRQAHDVTSAASYIYRRSGGGAWQEMRDGLPAPQGLLVSVLAAHEGEPGVFYAASNKGIYRSPDTGRTWEELPISWPSGTPLGRVRALVVA